MPNTRPKIIRLPNEPGLKAQLKTKLNEYQTSMPRGMQNLDDVLIVWKYVVLRSLLEAPDGQVDTDDLLRRMK